MAGSIRGSDIAEPAAAIVEPAASRPVHARRWRMLRRAAGARLAPFGVAVMLAALAVAILAPVLSPYDPLKQDLGNALAPPRRVHLLGTDHVGRDGFSRGVLGTPIPPAARF